ncbi:MULTISPECIES: acetyl-CoA carboxylase biotin carboxyl carrier protein [Paraburkholderia]|uniref:acetyl-CoA carboxylase biotin carboxyl carrier protein n=1 Tax=Paraburkholderia TaxID=1822464 RepID=UPI00225540BC|nr:MULTISPECIES: acetyl-CoA carboxylase biotin carboxyl carrier protein subunit [Paraburkholderia]MCX4176867.1 acetyl-CoA carboxylase biotin carboxyl carrier protein subunit [Paraburkholderia madseniana]MDQ6464858.1 acetyl-CoA carboxylase biotin carboxyl carrier protein subunit [Paraburkholderia madseniana]
MTQKIEVNIGELRQITSWLAEVDIEFIEISKPGATVRLTMEQAASSAGADASAQAQSVSTVVPGGLARAADTAQTQAVSITAKSAGIFLSTHPARSTPLVSAGDHVKPGDIVGLLQIAQLCVPVVASADGMVMRLCVSHGTTVGYGTPLLELSPSA